MKRSLKRIIGLYSIASGSILVLTVSYFALLAYPQPLFAYSAQYENRFTVYSRDPITDDVKQVVAHAEERLRKSPIYTADFDRRVYLAGGHGMYKFLSHKAYHSFAHSVPFLDNMIINRTDAAADKVFLDRPVRNSRSLSGVIAHEVAHLFIRQRYGTVKVMMMPTWKTEGYPEYVAGDSTMTLDEGLQLWRDNPADDTGYRYIKYTLMVKHLLENERLSVDDLFTSDMNETEVAARTFAAFK
jgi:hypothetical protein